MRVLCGCVSVYVNFCVREWWLNKITYREDFNQLMETRTVSQLGSHGFEAIFIFFYLFNFHVTMKIICFRVINKMIYKFDIQINNKFDSWLKPLEYWKTNFEKFNIRLAFGFCMKLSIYNRKWTISNIESICCSLHINMNAYFVDMRSILDLNFFFLFVSLPSFPSFSHFNTLCIRGLTFYIAKHLNNVEIPLS